MAREEGDYVLRGLTSRTHGIWDTGVDGLVEPLRAATW